MIMVQKGYPIGEFDIMFDGTGKAAEQMYVISKTSLGHGKMEVTKHSDVGESVIHFTEWTGNTLGPDVKEGWGVYKLKDGSNQVFTVLELAMSKMEISTLDDGLKSGNAYYVGVSCKDKKKCDFTKMYIVLKSNTTCVEYSMKKKTT